MTAANRKPPGKRKGKSKSLKLRLWLKHFLNSSNPATFLNKAASAREAGYNAKTDACFGVIGAQNLKRHAEKINKWIEEEGLTDEILKLKLIEGLECTQTIFKGHEVKGSLYIHFGGRVHRVDKALESEDPELAEAARKAWGDKLSAEGVPDGSLVDTGYIIETRQVIPWDIRRKYLELAMDIKRLIGPKRVQLVDEEEKPIDLAGGLSEEHRQQIRAVAEGVAAAVIKQSKQEGGGHE